MINISSNFYFTTNNFSKDPLKFIQKRYFVCKNVLLKKKKKEL